MYVSARKKRPTPLHTVLRYSFTGVEHTFCCHKNEKLFNLNFNINELPSVKSTGMYSRKLVLELNIPFSFLKRLIILECIEHREGIPTSGEHTLYKDINQFPVVQF